MGTVPTGTLLLRMIHSRVSWMLWPVERSIIVSAPQIVAHLSLLTSCSVRRWCCLGVETLMCAARLAVRSRQAG
jgi:hypothetical protein